MKKSLPIISVTHKIDERTILANIIKYIYPEYTVLRYNTIFTNECMEHTLTLMTEYGFGYGGYELVNLFKIGITERIGNKNFPPTMFTRGMASVFNIELEITIPPYVDLNEIAGYLALKGSFDKDLELHEFF